MDVSIEATAAKLLDVNAPDMAHGVLTNYSSQRALDGLSLGDSLLASVEARYRLLYGYRAPTGAVMSGQLSRDAEVGCVEPLPSY